MSLPTLCDHEHTPEGLWRWLVEGCSVDIKMSIGALHGGSEVLSSNRISRLVWSHVARALVDGFSGDAVLIPLFNDVEPDATFNADHGLVDDALELALMLHSREVKSPIQDAPFLIGKVMTLSLRIFDGVTKQMGCMLQLALNREAFRARYIDR